MKCLKCKNEITDLNNPCPYCGYKNDPTFLKYINDDQVKHNMDMFINHREEFTKAQKHAENYGMPKGSIEQIEEESYLIEYIGNNYESFAKGGFSFCYFFLGDLYALYRKQYILLLYRFLAVAIQLIYIYIFQSYSTDTMFYISYIILYIFLELAPSIFFKKYYYHKCKRQVEKIKKENQDKSPTDIKLICSSKGGTSIIIPIIAIIIIFAIIPRIITSIYNNITQTTTINGLTFKTNNYLNYNNNEIFTESYSNTIAGECYYSIKTTQINTIFSNSVTILPDNSTNITINNNLWKYYKQGNREYYQSINNNYIYTIEFEVINNNQDCQKAKDIFINSLDY